MGETWDRDYAVKHIDAMQAKIADLTAKLKIAEQAFGTLKPLQEPPLAKFSAHNVNDRWRLAEQAYEESKPICEANDAANQENQALLRKIASAISAAGITQSRRQLKGRSSWKTETVNCDWYSLLLASAPVNSHGTYWLNETWKRFSEIHTAEEKKKADARAAREREFEEKRREQIKLASLVVSAKEIGVDPETADLGDVIEAVRSKDKYLDLAIAMSDTRGDWSEGFYRVEGALQRFTIETQRDQEIYDEVSSVMDCDDGRVFRDLKDWNYGSLFAIADPKWRECYEKLATIAV